MTERKFDPVDLDHLFARVREHPAQPSADLMKRVLTDAYDAQAAVTPVTAPQLPGAPWLLQVFRELGGWPSMAGLTTAALVGVWLGISPPDGLVATADSFFGTDDDAYLIDVAPEATFEIAEGFLQ
ncbi:hypothetical protein [Roseovarius litorisediminis]|nr:hypothetical protein [Roseovarius litorisediminis]